MKRIFFLDAYALIYRAYYAFMKSARPNSKGMNTSTVYGFLNTLLDVLNRERPTHIAVAFDPKGPTFRHEVYKDYKAQREETPEDIRVAVPYIKQLLAAYRIPVYEVKGFEADDVIGTLAFKAEAAGFEVFMMTPDKDYGQLVSEHRFIYKPRFGGNGFDVLGIQEVLAKWGLEHVDQVRDLLGLMGDASDNIPGCPGVGEKTAVKLLNEFGSIEGLLANTEKLKGALRTKVEENAELIRFSHFLATIRTDVPIDFNEEDCAVKDADKEQLRALFTELEFRGHLAKLTNEGGIATMPTQPKDGQLSFFDEEIPNVQETSESNTTQVNDASVFATATTTPHSYHLVQSEEEIKGLTALLGKQKEFCFDTETTSLDPFDAELVGLSFAWEKHVAYYIAMPKERSAAEKVIGLLKGVLEDESIVKVGQNVKFDLLVLENYGVKVRGVLFDTMVAHYLLNPELRHGMDYMAEVLLHYQTIHIEELIGSKSKGQLRMDEVDVEKVKEYAAEDADITLQLKQVLAEQLMECGLEKLFYEVEMPLVRVLATMERNGVLIDDFALAQSSNVMTEEMRRIEHEIQQMAGTDINVSSPKQVGEFLFETLKIVEKPRKTKTGQYVTDEETLESLRGKHEVVGKILEYRSLKKLLSTYIDALPRLINAKTGKVHTSFNQTVTATGRLSSSNPNLQNIPVRDEQGREIRKAFVAERGCLFVSADYSQIELRIMAHLSGDENMITAFLSNQDIHAATAANIYKIPINEVTAEMRRKAKTANFGIIYGISAFGLAERLQIPRSEAKDLIDGYFATFPKVKTYIDEAIAKAREKGYVETMFHRKRYLPDITSHNANVRGYAERNAVNAPIQGTAADIIKIAMIGVARRIEQEQLKAQMILQVHDELNFNCPEEELEQLKTIVREEMEGAVKLAVPLKVDIGVGKDWLEAH